VLELSPRRSCIRILFIETIVRTIALLILSGLLLSGCARNYVITLNNGSRVSTTTKPKLVRGNYMFKDLDGQDSYVPMGRVAMIEPASEAKQDKSPYGVTPAR